MFRYIAISTVLMLGGCKEEGTALTLGEDADACSLTMDTVDGTEWVFLKANPDRTEVEEIRTRLTFTKDDEGSPVVKYNVGSLADMYDYPCEVVGSEFICKQEANPTEWCKAVIAGGAECTAEFLRGEEPTLSDEDIEAAIKAANDEYNRYKGTPNEGRWKATFHTLGNKLRGVLYIKIDSQRCRLRVTDNYKTYYGGRWIEDSNPAGTNPFVQPEEAGLLWEHCTNPLDLVDLKGADFPSDPGNVPNVGKHEVGADVHYWFLSGDYSAPEEGCSYSYDIWQNYRRVETGQTPTVVDARRGKQLHWHWLARYDTVGGPGEAEVVTFVIDKTCEGKDPVHLVTCNAIAVIEGAAPSDGGQ